MHLQTSLVNGRYKHGEYMHFEVNDSKRREIAVAPVRDRVVHRLLYDYLEPIWDKVFIYDAWSCRKGKGLHAATNRTAGFVHKYSNCWVWRADITKFFDSVDQAVLLSLIRRRISCQDTIQIIEEVLSSYYKNEVGRGMPIGNLTSQIFANVYLNEFDRYMTHTLKPLAYLRYGDDWLCFVKTKTELELTHDIAIKFLADTLKLNISQKVNKIQPAYRGFTFLGVDHWPDGMRLTLPTHLRLFQKIQPDNYSSYEALARQFSNPHNVKKFYWRTLDV